MSTSWKERIDRNLPVLLIGAFGICLIVWYIFAFVVPNHPSRPKNVPTSATLVFQGWTHFWQECWFDSQQRQDRCRIYNGGGLILDEDVFLPMDGSGPIPEDQLKIGSGGGPYSVQLLNGTVMIPRSHFDGIKRELQGDLSNAE